MKSILVLYTANVLCWDMYLNPPPHPPHNNSKRNSLRLLFDMLWKGEHYVFFSLSFSSSIRYIFELELVEKIVFMDLQKILIFMKSKLCIDFASVTPSDVIEQTAMYIRMAVIIFYWSENLVFRSR